MAKFFLVFVCLSVTVGSCWAALPSQCLSELIRPSSGQCCSPGPVIEIEFYLRFGCEVPTALDQGVRLEIDPASDSNWRPIRFYTPTLNQRLETTVYLVNDTTVDAEALRFNSSFPFHFVNTSQGDTMLVREYLCGGDYLTSNNARFRWMQRYTGPSEVNVSTWSIDSLTISMWDGSCLKTLMHEDFETNSIEMAADVQSGNVTLPPCGSTHSGNALYFNQFSSQNTPRRSISIRNVDLTGGNSECLSPTNMSGGECSVSNASCDSDDIVCSRGSFQCNACPAGHRVQGVACEDIDECSDGSHNCQGLAACVNTPGSFHCECPTGYRLSEEGTACQEIDECSENTHDCQGLATCMNTPGSFQCVCPSGYRLSQSNRSCEDIDECTEGTHDCQGVAVCNNTVGSFQCDCPTGYSPNEDDTSCQDIDECTQGTHSCQGMAMCSNTAGSFQCDCPTGYRLTQSNVSCEDVNECDDESTHDCQGVAMCNNIVGSFQCDCPTGYRRNEDGISCRDVDECAELIDNCGNICTNIPGSFVCGCPSGYVLMEGATSCTDVDECTDDSHNCQGLAACVNTLGSFQCECPTGYRLSGEGTSCQDIDECTEVPDVCDGSCTNTEGSFQCSCPTGFTLGEDQASCQDINECDDESTHGCQGVAVCSNTVGSYQCDCPAGYRPTLNSNLSCEEIPPIVVGFERPRYQVREESGNLTVCLQLLSGDVTRPIPLLMSTSDGTAKAGEDYVTVSESLTFSSDASSVCVVVSILDDDLDEGLSEYFLVSVALMVDESEGGMEGVTLERGDVRVVIIEQDGAVQRVNDIQDIIGRGNSSQAVAMLQDLLEQQLRSGQPASRAFSKQFLGTTSNLLSQLRTNRQANPGAAEDVLNLLDKFALRLYDETEPNIETDKFALSVRRYSPEPPGGDGVSREVGIREEGGGEISLPLELLMAAANGTDVKVASFFFPDLSDVLPSGRLPGLPGEEESEDTETVIGSPVISSSLGCANGTCPPLKTTDPVKIVLKKMEIDDFTQPACVFYDLEEKGWSSEGCTVNEDASNDSYVVCECTHLTHFAILLSPSLNISGTGHEFALQVIGYVFGSISFVCLILTVIALLFLRTLWGMRNYIHVNLCISLFIAQLIFVVAVDKTGNEKACQAIAVILHYFFLVTFMWMLMEGVVLYVALVRVFIKKQKLYMIAFTVASYGLPLLYMCLTVPLGLALKGPDGNPHYGSAQACWLRYDTHFIWAFIIPVILIIVANVGFFFMAVCIMYKHEKKGLKKDKRAKFSHWLKTSISLLVIMGITWIIGVLVFHEALLFVGYIFTIMVACQGLLIFILFVPVSKQVRESYKKWWRGKVSESEFLSRHFSSSDGSRRSLGRFSSLRTSSFRLSRFSMRSSRYDPEMQISKANSEGTSPPLSPGVKVQLQSFSQIDESVADAASTSPRATSNGRPRVRFESDIGTEKSNGVLSSVFDSTVMEDALSTDKRDEESSPVEGTKANGVVPASVEGTDSRTESPAKASEPEKEQTDKRVNGSTYHALPTETSSTSDV